MKLTKVLSLVLVVVMLASMLIACGGNQDDTTPAPTTPAPTTAAPTTAAPTTEAPTTAAPTTQAPATEAPTTEAPTTEAVFTPNKTWAGKTVNVYISGWYGTSGPWQPVEYWVAEYGQSTLNDAILDRTAYLNEEFGVTFDFTAFTTSPTSIDAIANALSAGTKDYDIWFNKTIAAQNIVANKLVFDLADSEYIDFSKSYYNQLTKNAFTIDGHTFFASGDFNYIAYEVTYLWYLNPDITEDIEDFPADIYQVVRDGEWTLDLAFSLARQYGQDNGDGIMDLNDSYGLSPSGLANWFNFCGISTVSAVDGQYEIGLNDQVRVQKILSYILQMANSDWYVETAWQDGSALFTEGRCLFFQEVVQKIPEYVSANPNIYLLPNPKLELSDPYYYTTGAYSQSNLICIPKTTEDREMSEYFFEILFKTGSEMIMPEYIEGRLMDANPDNYDDATDMLVNYILPGALIDVGNCANGWSSVCGNIINPSCNNKTNTFAADYAANIDAAQATVDTWNANWSDYTEE